MRHPLLFAFVSLVFLPSCAAHGHGYTRVHHAHGSSGADAAVAAIELIADIAQLVVTSQDCDPVVEEVVVAPTPPAPPEPPAASVLVVPPLSPLPSAPAPNAMHGPFDAAAARRALGAVDLSACRQHTAPRGYGHATITYTPDGTPVMVAVDAPSGLSPDAASCIGDRLGAFPVAPFSGGPVTVGTTYFVP
jgi:hypothetical protein